MERIAGTPTEMAMRLRREVREQVGLPLSVGVARTKFLAKVASGVAKPDGLLVVPLSGELAFLHPLPVERLWGVGASTRRALADYQVVTIGDLAQLPQDILTRRFGSQGPVLAARARGLDPSVVGDGAAAKSVSHEHTFDVDTADWEVLERTLLALSEGVAGRLRAGGVKAGTVAVKIRDTEFVTITRQRTLPQPTDLTEPIWRVAVALTHPEVRGMKVRLLGVAATHLTEREQLSLFGTDDDRRRRVVTAADRIRDRFGPRSITRARLLRSGVAEPFERDHSDAPEAPRVGRRSVERTPDDGVVREPVQHEP